MFDGDVVDLHWTEGFVVGVASHACDLLHQSNTGIVALPKDGVPAIQTRIWHLGDEELRTVGIRSRIRVCQASRTIELQVRRCFVLELIPRIARPSTCG